MISRVTAAVWSSPGSGAAASSPGPNSAGAAELLRRSGLGDQAAFATFYDQTCARLFRLVLQVLQDTVSAEQVAHAVYLHAWQHSARFDPSGGSALAWLMTMGQLAAVERLKNAPGSPLSESP